MIPTAPPPANQVPLDVALVASPTTPGRLTFSWDATGDLVWDNSQAYSVLVTVAARKGQYRPDRTFGTLLYTVVQDKSTTASQLSAYALDGMQQVAGNKLIPTAAAGLITSYTATATRITTGRWGLRLAWKVNGTDDVSRTMRF